MRARFYEGQFLGAADLTTLEQAPRVADAQHLLGAHTWGIGVGLDLIEKTLPSGEVQILVTPGYAWDGYGRPIVVLAPATLSPALFANFQGTTQPAGQLVKVWIHYGENEAQNPPPNFEACGVDDQHARVIETFALTAGEPAASPNDGVTIAGRSLDPLDARSAFAASAPPLYDESVPYQDLPVDPTRRWLVPIGYVRWQKPAGQAGRFVARDDSGASGARDSDLIRAFRQYIGLVVETVNAADGVIRLRDPSKDPDPAKTFFHTPTAGGSPANPDDLVWVEGSLRVQGDVRLAAGQLEWRTEDGLDGNTPTWIGRGGDAGKAVGQAGGRAIQIAIGRVGQDPNRLAVGPVRDDGTIDEQLTVLSSGEIGVGTTTPVARLDVAGRILRNGAALTSAGTAGDGQAIDVPWGTTDDWNVFVSPNSAGREEGDSEGDNALLMVECAAAPNTAKTAFQVTIRYKYRFSNNGEGTWYGGTANYLLAPR